MMQAHLHKKGRPEKMHKSVRLSFCILVFIAAFSPLTLSGASLWFGDKDGLHQIDPGTNRVILNVPFEAPVSIAVNGADGSVWTLTQTRLARLSAQGVLQLQIAL